MQQGVILSLHGAYSRRTSLLEDLQLARSLGYSGLELWIHKLDHYVAGGGTLDQLARAAGPLRFTMLDVLLGIETIDRDAQRKLQDECRRMAHAARVLGCPLLQVVALGEFRSTERGAMRGQLRAALDPLVDIAASHDVRLALEPVSFSPFRSIADAATLVRELGSLHIGLILDTWHLWTAGTPWTEVAALDRSLIVCAHLGDCQARAGATWCDADRIALPGEGVVPLAEAVTAIRATGFCGPWAVELLGETQLAADPASLARAMREQALPFLDAYPSVADDPPTIKP